MFKLTYIFFDKNYFCREIKKQNNAMRPNGLKYLLIAFLMIIGQSTHAQKFKVVLDAGHGGKDFGAVRTPYVEKKIVLDVALRVGKLLEKHKDIEVVYTRKTDVFIELRKRSEIANKAKADLFVSIHTNAYNGTEAIGAETFVMGTSKNASHLEVAKRENAVITLEDDYEMKYEGFDPNKPETIIGLTLLQDQYIAQSIDLASRLQTKFTYDLKRRNRGVKQAPFWVLHSVFMPSVLIELGFISNAAEGKYLDSDEGRQDMADAIAQAIIDYKKIHQNSEPEPTTPAKEEPKPVEQQKPEVVENTKEPQKPAPNTNEETIKGVEFMVQIAASSRKIDTTPSNFKGLSDVSAIKEGTLYKYLYKRTKNYEAAKNALADAKKQYPTSFLVAYKNGKKISIQEALENN